MKALSIVASEYPVACVMVLKSSKAEVTRSFNITLEEGRNRLKISKLPTTIEQESIRISILHNDGTPVDSSVYLSDIVCSPADNPGDDPTKRFIRSLEVKKSGLQSEKKMLDTQAEVMVTYARSLTGQHATPDAVDNFLSAFELRGRKNIEAVLKIEQEITEIDEQIKEILRKKALIKGGLNTELAAVIVADNKLSVQFQLIYVVNNAKWSPSYELHAITGEDGKPSRTVSFHYHASIKQVTGEDWTDASITLSTVATDTIVKKIPQLAPIRVSAIPQLSAIPHPPIAISRQTPVITTPLPVIIQRSRSRSSSYSRRRRSRSHSPVYDRTPRSSRLGEPTSFRVAPDFRMSQEQPADDGVLVLSDDELDDVPAVPERRRDEIPTKMVTQTPMTLTYAVRGKSNVPSDGKEHIVTIAILTFEANVEYISVPRLDPRVFLQCQVKNTSDYRLLPGPVSVIMDRNYVSRTTLSDVNRNETFTFTLGDDPSITISYERASTVTKKGTRTFADPIDISTYTTTIMAHNTHEFAIENFIVRDAAPVSGDNNRVKVVLRKPEELIEAKEGVFVEVNDVDEAAASKDDSEDEGSEGLMVRWEKEEDGLYEYKWRIGGDDRVKFETVFDVTAPADLKFSLSNFEIQGKA